jgi:hypothetical protein
MVFLGAAALFGWDEATRTRAGGHRVILSAHLGAYPITRSVSLAEADRAELGLQSYVASLRPEIASRFSRYYEQVYGVTVGGRPLIRLNFVCEEEILSQQAERPRSFRDLREWWDHDWTRHPIEVEDGGDCFFHVDFDPVTGHYDSLHVNGRA